MSPQEAAEKLRAWARSFVPEGTRLHGGKSLQKSADLLNLGAQALEENERLREALAAVDELDALRARLAESEAQRAKLAWALQRILDNIPKEERGTYCEDARDALAKAKRLTGVKS